MLSSLRSSRACGPARRHPRNNRRPLFVEPLEERTLLAGLSVIESGGTTVVGGAGTSDTLTVALTEMPASKVVVDAISSDFGVAKVSPARLTFTPANWNIPQTVTVLGVNDPVGTPTAT